MFKGTSASAGIGIGKAVIVEEAELVITRNEVADAEAEIQRFKGALEKTIAATEDGRRSGFPRGREGSRDYAGTHDAVIRSHAYRGD